MDSNTTTYTKTFSIDLERANYHLKMKKRKQKRMMIVLALWALVIIYFVTPLSKVNLKVNGNVYYSKEELVKMGYINENMLWWLFDKDDAIKVLESYEYINKVEIKKSLLGTKMYLTEIYPVGYINDSYVLNNGSIIVKDSYPNNSKIQNITSFNNIDNNDLIYLSSKYSKVNFIVRNRIKDVEIINDSNNYKYIKLIGYDERIGNFIIKVDLVYLDTKFKENKYDKIIEEISKNNVKYNEDKPVLVAYHYLNEEEFHVVENFEEE